MNFYFDMNLYKVFYVVAKNNSFSKAAEELYVTQPSISYSIKQLEDRLNIKLLENNEIDFVIDTSPIETVYKNLVIEPLMELEHCFISSKDYEIDNKNIKVENLNNYNLILPVKRSTPRKQLTNLLKTMNIELKPFMTIEATEMLIDAIKKRMGIGYVIRDAIQEELESKNLKEINVGIQLPKLLLNLVYIESNLTNIPKSFIEVLKFNN